MKKDWISDAFKEASENADFNIEINNKIDQYLSEFAEPILDSWMSVLESKVQLRIYHIMQDEKLSEAFYNMSKAFAMAGYCLRMQEDEED